MFTQVIALLSNKQVVKSYEKLEKLHIRGVMNFTQYIQLSANIGKCSGTTTVLLRHDTPEWEKAWLCGFFANA